MLRRLRSPFCAGSAGLSYGTTLTWSWFKDESEKTRARVHCSRPCHVHRDQVDADGQGIVLAAARQALQDELARLQAAGTQAPTKPPARDAINESGAGNGHARGNGEAVLAGRTAAEAARSGKPATASQVKAICSIARRHEADLDFLLRENYGVARPEELTVPQASRIIDLLKATANA
jgi:hypothetical protein